MTGLELELVRAACGELPDPSEHAVVEARRALRREIVSTPANPQRRLRVAAGSFVLVAALVVAAALVLTNDHSSFAVRVAEAANGAASPARNELVHSISRTTVRITNRIVTTTSGQRDDSWWTTTPPTEIDRTSYGAAGTVTTLTSTCGSIIYDSKAKLFTVYPTAGTFAPIDDPVATGMRALRSGHIHYRGKLRYRGIPAAKLLVTQYGSTTTYIVRRDNGYPLETIDRRVTSYSTRTAVTTYALFEHLPRTQHTLRHVRLIQHPDAFVVRTARAARTPACAGFGSLESLTGRRTTQ